MRAAYFTHKNKTSDPLPIARRLDAQTSNHRGPSSVTEYNRCEICCVRNRALLLSTSVLP
jgi:hypothetical protein